MEWPSNWREILDRCIKCQRCGNCYGRLQILFESAPEYQVCYKCAEEYQLQLKEFINKFMGIKKVQEKI